MQVGVEGGRMEEEAGEMVVSKCLLGEGQL